MTLRSNTDTSFDQILKHENKTIICFTKKHKYVHIKVVVHMFGPEYFCFFEHNSWPCRLTGTKISGNDSYRPPRGLQTNQESGKLLKKTQHFRDQHFYRNLMFLTTTFIWAWKNSSKQPQSVVWGFPWIPRNLIFNAAKYIVWKLDKLIHEQLVRVQSVLRRIVCKTQEQRQPQCRQRIRALRWISRALR